MDNINTYISVLHGSLRKKLELIKEILELTKEQNSVLSQEEVDVDSFDRLVSQKEVKINEVLGIDNGFQSLYNKISGPVKENPQMYRQQILEMQNFKVSNKTAVSYYKNMSNQHREWQSYFVDSRK